VYCGGQNAGAWDHAWLAVLPAPAMGQVGKALPLARSRNTWVMGGTHCGIARQLGAARHSKTRHPSTANAEAGSISASAKLVEAIHPAAVVGRQAWRRRPAWLLVSRSVTCLGAFMMIDLFVANGVMAIGGRSS